MSEKVRLLSDDSKVTQNGFQRVFLVIFNENHFFRHVEKKTDTLKIHVVMNLPVLTMYKNVHFRSKIITFQKRQIIGFTDANNYGKFR